MNTEINLISCLLFVINTVITFITSAYMLLDKKVEYRTPPLRSGVQIWTIYSLLHDFKSTTSDPACVVMASSDHVSSFVK